MTYDFRWRVVRNVKPVPLGFARAVAGHHGVVLESYVLLPWEIFAAPASSYDAARTMADELNLAAEVAEA